MIVFNIIAFEGGLPYVAFTENVSDYRQDKSTIGY